MPSSKRQKHDEHADWLGRPQFRQFVTDAHAKIEKWVENHPAKSPSGNIPYHSELIPGPTHDNPPLPSHMLEALSPPSASHTRDILSTISNPSIKFSKPGSGVRVSHWKMIKRLIQEEMDAEVRGGKGVEKVCGETRRRLRELGREIAALGGGEGGRKGEGEGKGAEGKGKKEREVIVIDDD